MPSLSHSSPFYHPQNIGRERAISIAYSDRVFVALGIHKAMRIRRIVICGLSGSAIFSHIIS